jgi:hypothetical protein
MKYEHVDYGIPELNLLHYVGIIVVMLVIIWKMPRPWSHILGVGVLWSPIIILQFLLGRPLLGILLIIIALFILKDIWKDD